MGNTPSNEGSTEQTDEQKAQHTINSTTLLAEQPKNTVADPTESLNQWKMMIQNGIQGVCDALELQLHFEAAHEQLEPWGSEDTQTEVADDKIVNKCIQVLIDMPGESSDYVQDRNTTRDMELFTTLFKHAIEIVTSYDQRTQQLAEETRLEDGEPRRSKHHTTNELDSDEEYSQLSTKIHSHDDDSVVPSARKTIKGCLIFLSEVGKLTTSDGTDRWFGMKDAIKQTHVVSIVVRLLHAYTTHNTFVFWGLNALYFCCRDGPLNDWENIEVMRKEGGIVLCETLRGTCSSDSSMLVHVQLLHTMMTMKDDDDEDLLNDSLAAKASRVKEKAPGFGTKVSKPVM